MTPFNLIQIARQASSGDDEARRAFESQVVPLVETVVRRWLKQQSRALTHPTSGSGTASVAPAGRVSSEDAGRITAAVCSRLIGEFRAPAHGGARLDETHVARQLLDTLLGSVLPARC